jgi:hypothetical protein
MAKRCAWCGQWVAGGTEPTTRSLHTLQGDYNFSQTLCPQHARDWSLDSDWNRPDDPNLPTRERAG